MTSFWVVVGVFIVGALLFVIPTLLRKDNRGGVGRKATNVSVYRDQLAELEADLHSDILTREQYEQSKRELQQRMLEDVPEQEPAAATRPIGSGNNTITIALVALALPLMAVSLYLWLGDTRALAPRSAAEQMPISSNQDEGGHQNISSVVDNLMARLEDQPDDLEGWIMLGRTYAIMQRFGEASVAYEKALALAPESAEIITDYADIVAMTNNGSLMGKPTELVQKALLLDPNNPKALALAGTAEFEMKKFGRAAEYWEQLLALVPADSELAQSIAGGIAEAKSLAAGKGSIAGIQPEGTPGGRGTAGNETGKPVQTASDAGAASRGTLSGTISLSPALAGKISPSDSLYVFARAQSGPKAPLATLRLQAKDLPAAFTLDDSMARSGVQLSNFPNPVIVGARISKSGSPMPQSGDLQGLSRPTSVGSSSIEIVIDQQLP